MGRSAAIVGVLIVVLAGCGQPEVAQEEIRAFIDDYERSAEYLDRQEAATSWEYVTTGYSDSLSYYRNLASAYAARESIYRESGRYLTLTEDSILLKKLELIHRRTIRGVIERSETISRLADSLSGAAGRFVPVFESKAATTVDVERVLASDSSRFRRQDAWMSLAARGEQLAGGVTLLAKLRNRTAARLSFNSYYDLMLTADGLDKSEYLGWLREWDRLTAEPYRRAVDSVARLLGVTDLRPWDIDYAAGEQIISAYYPPSQHLARLRSTLTGIGLSLNRSPIYISSGKVPDGDPTGGIYRIDIPRDIRVVAVLDSGSESLEILFLQAGRGLYAAHIGPGDFLESCPPAPCYDWGMGLFIQGLARLDAWRLTYAAIPEPIVAEAAARRRFWRLHEFRLMLVDLQFEYEMYKNPTSDLHQVYRELFERYMMFPYPENVRQWADHIDYITDPVGLQNRLVGTAIAAQVYHCLMGANGAVLDAPPTGQFLIDRLWRPGGARSWRELVRQGTGEEFNPRYLLEYLGL